MLNLLRARSSKDIDTIDIHEHSRVLPDRFRGRPEIDATLRAQECRVCVDACPTDAIDTRHTWMAAGSGALSILHGHVKRRARPTPFISPRIIDWAREHGMILIMRTSALPLAQALEETDASPVWSLAQAAPSQRWRLQRLRGGCQCAQYGGVRSGALRHPVCGFSSAR